MKRLFLFSLPALAFVWAFSPVTSLKVSGKITDEHGKGLGGVSVTIPGSAKGTSSATDGTYSIEANGEKDVLVFSFVGYETKKEKINGRPLINVVLKASKKK